MSENNELPDQVFPKQYTSYGYGVYKDMSATYIREDTIADKTPIVCGDVKEALEVLESRYSELYSRHFNDYPQSVGCELFRGLERALSQPSSEEINAALHTMHEEELPYTITISSDPDGCDAHDFETMVNLKSLVGNDVYETIIRSLKLNQHPDEILIDDWEELLGKLSFYKISFDDDALNRLNDAIRHLPRNITHAPALDAVKVPVIEGLDEALSVPFCNIEQSSIIFKAAIAYLKLQSAAPATSPDDGWRTIDSAPRDGTSVLLYGGDWAFEAQWRDNEWYTAYPNGDEPTHWMPLPNPPTM